jgi:uncharacterized protein (TIGR00369 family)
MTDKDRLDASVPIGFMDPGVGGFAGRNGPIYQKLADGKSLAGFLVEEHHCNPSGICHGGWLSTFADVQLVRQVGLQTGLKLGNVRTVSLTTDFLSAAKLGDWVDGSAEMVRETRTLAFVEGRACVAGRLLLRMNAIFSLRRENTVI